MDEPCRMPGCSGHYEDMRIERAQHLPDGNLVLVTGIPARVCDFCGDTYLVPATIEALERLRRCPLPPRAHAPRYDLSKAPAPVAADVRARAPR